ncbi:DUF2510 domain-containing protein [Nocardioides rubriscoriae]|uniref:DUF2510 domain-containing protein n=1 Tax=Nocardioides rubriscoriae TaxID=642762 RepID=UPI0011E027D6|nr:DUF2510 domain-containing protein [Nocardioides rubriscoriae]
MTQGTTPPGWYDDGSGTRRWWDGSGWTEHTQPVPALPPQGPTGPRPAGPPPGWPPDWQPDWQSGWQPAAAYSSTAAGPTGPGGRGRGKGLLLAAIGGVLALLAIAGVVLVLVLGRDDDPQQADDTPSPDVASSSATVEPSEPAPTSDAPTGSPADPVDPSTLTCGEVRAMSTRELVDLLDRAAQDEVDRTGDQDAQDYLDLPADQKRTFAAFLPSACEGESDATTLDELDGF